MSGGVMSGDGTRGGAGAAVPRLLPRRDQLGHKGTFGTVVVVGGSALPSARMVGAPALTALGALRAGAGLVKMACPAGVLESAMQMCPSATGIAMRVDASGALIAHEAAAVLDGIVDELAGRAGCVVVGPGLGAGDGVRAAALRLVQQQDVPLVVDADAINALAEIPELFRDFHARAILTPHPGEFRRLAAALRITLDPVDPRTREAAAMAMAQRLGCVVVLKGAGTVVSDGLVSWTCRRGHACMATAGSGDVLTGVVGGIVSQFVGPPPVGGVTPKGLTLMHAACCAVEAHARAGEAWAARRGSEAGMLAEELAEMMPGAMEAIRELA